MSDENKEKLTDDVVVTKGNKISTEDETLEYFETKRFVSKRVKKFSKPIVYKTETEYLDPNGNVINVEVAEIDEKLIELKERIIEAQSVNNHENEEELEDKPQLISGSELAEKISNKKAKVVKKVVSFSDLNPIWVKPNLETIPIKERY